MSNSPRQITIIKLILIFISK